jgi:hypothetical protein
VVAISTLKFAGPTRSSRQIIVPTHRNSVSDQDMALWQTLDPIQTVREIVSLDVRRWQTSRRGNMMELHAAESGEYAQP